MARINIEDDLESHDEFWNLVQIVGGDRDKALGQIVRFFRLAQKAFGQGLPITDQDLDRTGLLSMVKSGWAVPFEGGYSCKGADVHFAWYVQKIQAGKKGGRPKKQEPEESGDNRAVYSVNPLTPTLSPSPAPIKKNYSQPPSSDQDPKKQVTTENLKLCFDTWLLTLKLKKSGRSNLIEREEIAIAQAIQRDGAPAVAMALKGVAHTPPDEGFDESWFLDVTRVLGPKNFLRFVNLGTTATRKEKESA